MNKLRENILIGGLVALLVGPALSANTNVSTAVRLSSFTLIAALTGGRAASELWSQLSQTGTRNAALTPEARNGS